MDVKVTKEMLAKALPTFDKAVSAKLKAIGARSLVSRFRAEGKRDRVAKRFYQKFLKEGGTEGDWQSFFQFLLDHMDEILAALSKIIALFAV